jgi:hypothetical protein
MGAIGCQIRKGQQEKAINQKQKRKPAASPVGRPAAGTNKGFIYDQHSKRTDRAQDE